MTERRFENQFTGKIRKSKSIKTNHFEGKLSIVEQS